MAVEMIDWKMPKWAHPDDTQYELLQHETASLPPRHSKLHTQWRCAAIALATILAVVCSFLIVLTSLIIKDKGSHELVSMLSPSPVDRILITYVYHEDEHSINRDNLQFFLQHGVHSKADFIFIFNGETDAWQLVPDLPNVNLVRRDNTCYDLGAHAEVLQIDDTYKSYKRFIMMNGSLRGPFLPYWAEACWSDRYLSKVTEETKLVGMSWNCWPTPHIESMIWATDSIGLELLLHPPSNSPSHNEFLETINIAYPGLTQPHEADWVDQGINQCFPGSKEAVEAEISGAGIIRAAGYKADALLTKFHIDEDFLSHCNNHPGSSDPQGNGNYDGMNYHPYEAMFIKTNRGIDPHMIALMTQWTNEANFTSWDYC